MFRNAYLSVSKFNPSLTNPCVRSRLRIGFQTLGTLILFYFFYFGIFLFLEWPTTTTPYFTYGDISSDMLLSKISNSQILTHGHYSRFGFYHPGPFFLSSLKHLESLLALFFPSATRTNLWFIGNAVIQTFWLTLITFVMADVFRKMHLRWLFATIIPLLVLDRIHSIHELWMPCRLVIPYLLMLVSCVHLGSGSMSTLPILTMTIFVLLHGYVTMPLVVFGPVMTSFVLFWLCKQKHGETRLQWIFSFLVAILFSIPWGLDLLRENSNIFRILQQTNSNLVDSHSGLRSALDVFHSVVDFPERWLVFSIPGAFLLKGIFGQTALVRATLLTVVVSGGSTLLFGVWSPPPLMPYMISFSASLLFLPIGIFLPPLVDWGTSRHRLLGVFSVLYIFCSLASGIYKNHFVPVNFHKIDDLTRQFEDLVKQSTLDPDKPSVISMSDKDSWSIVLGVLAEADSRGYRVCTNSAHIQIHSGPIFFCPNRPTEFIIQGAGGPEHMETYTVFRTK